MSRRSSPGRSPRSRRSPRWWPAARPASGISTPSWRPATPSPVTTRRSSTRNGTPRWGRRSAMPWRPTCRAATCSGWSTSRSRATPVSSFPSTTPTGRAKPTTRSPARTPTTRCGSPTSFSRPSSRMATGSCCCGLTASRRRRSRRGSCGTRSAGPPGLAPIPACSSIRPSTSGTPALPMAGSTPATRAVSTCSSTTRPATWRASTSACSTMTSGGRSTSRPIGTRFGCGPSRSRSAC